MEMLSICAATDGRTEVVSVASYSNDTCNSAMPLVNTDAVNDFEPNTPREPSIGGSEYVSSGSFADTLHVRLIVRSTESRSSTTIRSYAELLKFHAYPLSW